MGSRGLHPDPGNKDGWAERIGVIGGTFDPIHVGHLIIAQEALTRLGLDQIVFVPAGTPPHKLDHPITDPEHRLEMVRLAVAGNERFSVSRIDIDRSGPCYTVDTIRLLQDAWSGGTEIYFLIGADSLIDLPTWHRPDLLLRLCHVVALARPGYQVDMAALEHRLPGIGCSIQLIDAPTLDISATELRDRVRRGWSIRYLVPHDIESYIKRHCLYRDFS